MPEEAGASPSQVAVRCVLWRPRGATSPEALLSALDRRSIKVRTSESPFGALAQVCRMERPSSADQSEPHVLLLDRPEQLEDVTDVVAAVTRYAPRTACWLYEPTTPPTLRAVDPDDLRSWDDAESAPTDSSSGSSASGAPPAPSTPKKGGSGPSLRLTGATPAPTITGPSLSAGPPTTPSTTEPAAQTTREVLSDEELEMLLADERTRDERDAN